MAIITVFPGTSAIQNAVNAADPGDVILVNNGVYNEEVTITTSNIRIVAASDRVFLDGNNTLRMAFNLDGVTGVEINGFNIANYTSEGINVDRNMDRIPGEFNLITCNTITNVGSVGIDLDSGAIGNLILGNTVQNTGSGLSSIGISVEDRNNWVVNNTVRSNLGIGICVSAGDTNSGVIGNIISNNGGAGLLVFGDFNIFERNIVARNQNNGLVLESGADRNFIFKNLFSNNQPNNIVDNGIGNNFLKNRIQ